MRTRVDMDNTNIRSVYNKARKAFLAENGKIRCSYCKYHKNENSTRYGQFKSKPKEKDHR